LGKNEIAIHVLNIDMTHLHQKISIGILIVSGDNIKKDCVYEL